MRRYALITVTLGLLAALTGCAGEGAETLATEPPVQTGWIMLDGSARYYLDDGTLATGWQDMAAGRRYFSFDGTMLTGWQEIGGRRYYFTGDGVAVRGWQQLGEKLYYFDADGAMVTGEVSIGGELRRFDGDGALLEGLVTDGDGVMRIYSRGIPLQGWVELEGRRYYAAQDGSLVTGWLTLGEYDYYFHTDGTVAVGPTRIGEAQHYFTPTGIHVVLVNPWNYVPDYYTVDLVEYNSYYQVDRACYTALLQMMADCQAAGYSPMVCSAYRTQSHQSRLFRNKTNYYLEKGLSQAAAQTKAAKVVAVPGTSEHQLGLAVDLVSTDYYVLDESQANTQTQQWFMEHCWEYGFILRYPDGTTEITGIIYEPWHYRYVGTEVSIPLRDLGITLEEYLGAVPAAG